VPMDAAVAYALVVAAVVGFWVWLQNLLDRA